jgi:hypothetical protein
MDTTELAGIGALIAVSIFGSTGFWTYLATRDKDDSALEELIKGLARYQIISEVSKHQEQGLVSPQEFADIHTYLYKPYTTLGGNGIVSKYVAILDSLPLYTEGDTARHMKVP